MSNETSDNAVVPMPHVSAVCPHCNREESFEGQPTAQAWLTGHIQTEHEDKLPSYEGTGADGET